MNPLTRPNSSCSTLAMGTTQLVVQEAAEITSCRIGSYSRSLTPTTTVRSAPLPGAEISTLRAPPLRCAATASRARNLPVDSMTMLAPSSPQSIAAGSRWDRTAIGVPSTMSESGPYPTEPSSRPYVESNSSRCARVRASVTSLTATTSRSSRSRARRMKARPIRPKPLIPTVVVICILPCSRSGTAPWPPVPRSTRPKAHHPHRIGPRASVLGPRWQGRWSLVPAGGSGNSGSRYAYPRRALLMGGQKTEQPPADMTALPDLLHGRGRSGPVRQRRPVYVDLLPPCNAGCPAGENIQAWLAHAQAGRYEQAWRQLAADNPLAAIHGRVCYHPCETACNRASLDSAVSIHAVERFLGDLARERGWAFGRPAASTGRRVLVIGSGPSGLSAAYHLARLGHEVEVRDSGEQPGGMMRYGIPAYRLPRDVLGAELDRIAGLGVRFTQGHRVSDLAAERADGRFDAVFVAVGAHLSKRVDIPAGDAGRIVDALSFLRSVAEGERPVIGRKVAVYGGGNTAMDAARVARRLGADDALIVYRRTRAQMPAHEEEAADAEREGVRINWLRTITAFDGPELTVEAME